MLASNCDIISTDSISGLVLVSVSTPTKSFFGLTYIICNLVVFISVCGARSKLSLEVCKQVLFYFSFSEPQLYLLKVNLKKWLKCKVHSYNVRMC